MAVAIMGMAISRGVAIGRLHRIERGRPEIPERALAAGEVAAEVARFQAAVEKAQEELRELRHQTPPDTPPEIHEFFDAHILMMADAALTEAPIALIHSRRCNAEWALKLEHDSLVRVFEEMEDPYLRTRKDDVDYVVARIQRCLLNQQSEAPVIANLEGRILLAADLSPAEVVWARARGVIGLITGQGGPLSHTAILARSFRLPAVVGAHEATRLLQEGELIVLDGEQGTVLAGPDETTLRHYRERQRRDSAHSAGLMKLREQPAVTRDGVPIRLLANVERPEDVHAAVEVRAEGVGLFRTESMFLERSEPPDEQAQFEHYCELLRILDGRPLTVRTWDLGADKPGPLTGALAQAPNPALSLRAVRLCLRDAHLFRPQLRAILRASAFGPIRLLIPMLSNLKELWQVMALLDTIKAELDREGSPFDERLPLGGMIEVPAAAISAHLFARHLHFMSIGTNDLIQYTLAIDRTDNAVNYLYDPLHPAVLCLLDHVLQAGSAAQVPVSLCGEMAGDVQYTRLLLGLGLREFSLHPSYLLEVKAIVRDSDTRPLQQRARELLLCSHTDEVAQQVHALNYA